MIFSSRDSFRESLELLGAEKTDVIKINCSVDKCFAS